MTYPDPYKEPETVRDALHFVRLWFRARHAIIQVVVWILFWWLLTLLYIWQTHWTLGRKIALSLPIIIFVLSVYAH
jgi:hypothetical protein